MTLPTSWKDQLVAFGIEPQCEDIRFQGSAIMLHTSTSDCAILITPGGSFCGGGFNIGFPPQVYVTFTVQFRGVASCQPYTPPDTILDSLSCSKPIYSVVETTTANEVLQGNKSYRVTVIAGSAYPICEAITLTATNTCGDIAYGTWKPTCYWNDCLNCSQVTYAVPGLNFDHDQTYFNPVSYSAWLGGGYGAGDTWIEKYRAKLSFAGPTKFTAIRRIIGNCPEPFVPIKYKVTIDYLTESNGIRWQNGSPYSIDLKMTGTGTGYLVFSGSNISALDFTDAVIDLQLHRNDYSFYRKTWVPRTSPPYILEAKEESWVGCWGNSAPGLTPPPNCTAPAPWNTFRVADTLGYKPEPPYGPCGLDEQNIPTSVNLRWVGVRYDALTNTFSGTPVYPVPMGGPGGFIPGADAATLVPSIGNPCGSAIKSFVTC
ncbi:MAG: hypothetical protein U0930_04725 [Pirellulales bacterium]